MHVGVKLKFWFFEHYWWLVCLSVLTALVALLFLGEPVTTIATVVGAILSLAYFLQKQKLEELRLFRELFKEFNERYDEINGDLACIAALNASEVTADHRLKVVDYLNLCGEEYLYYKRGYIEPSVWTTWLKGMQVLISSPAIGEIWNQEKTTGAYYDLPL